MYSEAPLQENKWKVWYRLRGWKEGRGGPQGGGRAAFVVGIKHVHCSVLDGQLQ